MPDLHSRIRTELDRRLAVAQAATQWEVQTQHVYMDGSAQVRLAARGLPALFPMSVLRGADAQYFRDHEPAAAILRYTRDLAVLERHAPTPDGTCSVCLLDTMSTYQEQPIAFRADYPCDEVTALAESLGIPTTPPTVEP